MAYKTVASHHASHANYAAHGESYAQRPPYERADRPGCARGCSPCTGCSYGSI